MRSLVQLFSWAFSLALSCVACHTQAPLPPAGELAGWVRSNNAFAIDLYAQARAQQGNLVLSPIGLSTTLTMSWAGARGETAAQMKKVLHAEETPESTMSVSGRFLAHLRESGEDVTLRVANRIFAQKTYPFEQAYLDRAKAASGPSLEGVDFKGAAEDSRIHINSWIEDETGDRIKDLVPAGGITDKTRLVLANAVYFLGDWKTPFKAKSTLPAPFHVTAATSEQVPTMHQTDQLKFAEIDGVKVLEVPYKGGQEAMLLVLPDAIDGLDAVEKRLSIDTIGRWVGAMQHELVRVALPKIEVNPTGTLPVGRMLKEMGMTLAFDPNAADFTAIAHPERLEERLYISETFQKVFVKLDEKGTEAAAATVTLVDMFPTAGAPPKAQEFVADHPFLFFLRHVPSGAILFMGRVGDPSTR